MTGAFATIKSTRR